jgi:hypothetical protein
MLKTSAASGQDVFIIPGRPRRVNHQPVGARLGGSPQALRVRRDPTRKAPLEERRLKS